MSQGLDIYRYQTVTDWKAVKQSGLANFILVKLTDGMAPAVVRGDAQVNGCKNVGIPVGGYHFAQKGNPRGQAAVFRAELKRLKALDIMPALDIENTGVSWGGNEAHDFTSAFCEDQLEYYPRVLVYANTSELRAMRAAEIARRYEGRVLIWEANYGSNNGVRGALPANAWAPWRAIHQYTSKGRVPGIIQDTDLNWSFMDLSLEDDDMVTMLDTIDWDDGRKVPLHQLLAQVLVNTNRMVGLPNRTASPWGNMTPDDSEPVMWIVQLLSQSNANNAALVAILAEATSNPDITQEWINERLQHYAISAEAVAAALRPGLVNELLASISPELAEAVGEDVAQRVLTNLGQKLLQGSVQ